MKFCVSHRNALCQISVTARTHMMYTQHAYGTGVELQIQCEHFRTCLSHQYLHINCPQVVCLPPLLGYACSFASFAHNMKPSHWKRQPNAWMHEKQHHKQPSTNSKRVPGHTLTLTPAGLSKRPCTAGSRLASLNTSVCITHTAPFNPKTSISVQEHHPYTGNVNSARLETVKVRLYTVEIEF